MNRKQKGKQMKNKSWKVFQLIQLAVFAGLSIFLFVRTLDGTGAVETPQAKLIGFVAWTAFYLALLIIEWGIYFLVKWIRR